MTPLGLTALIFLVPISGIAMRRVTLAPLVPLAMWMFIPPTMNAKLFGLNFHIATFAIALLLALMVLRHGRMVLKELDVRPWVYLVLTFIVLVFGTSTALSGADTSIAVFVNQIAAPTGLFLLVRTTLQINAHALRTLVLGFVTLAATQATIAICQFATKSFGVYAQYFEDEKWWSGSYYRSVGTMNHFLTLGLVCAVAVPMVNMIRSELLRVSTLILLLAGVTYSQSRLALIVASIAAVHLLLTSSRNPSRVLVALGVTLVAALAGWRAGVLDPVLGRFEDDAASNELRGIAYAWFGEHWTEHVFSFQGMGSSFSVGKQAGLTTSFESAFIMYAIDFGLVGAVTFFGLLLLLALKTDRPPYIRIAAVTAIVLPMGFSSLAIDSAAGCTVWYAVALATKSGRTSGSSRATLDDFGSSKARERSPRSLGHPS